MKKLIYIYALIMLNTNFWSQINIQSDYKNPYVNEIFEIKATIPGDDTQAPVRLIVSGLKYEIINKSLIENFSFNNVTGETESSVSYDIKLIVKEPGEAIISCKIDNSISQEIVVNIRPIMLEDKDFPILHTEVSNNQIYIGEKGTVSNLIFSDKYISRVNYKRPFINMSIKNLYTYRQRDMLINGNRALYEVISSFSYESYNPGTFVIPKSTVKYNDIIFEIPSSYIDVLPLPDNVNKSAIVGKSLDIEVLNFELEYKHKHNIDFFVEISGNVNLSTLISLRKYFKIPSFINEEVQFRREEYRDGELFHIIRFRYSGKLNSLIGLNIRGIKIPFFNTETKEYSYITSHDFISKGNIKGIFLYLILFFVILIIIGIVIFALHIFKNKPKVSVKKSISNEPAEIYNLSKRESEIFVILINGKSTKDIADELFISPETVKKHIQSILKKTKTNSRLELLALVNTLK